MKLEEPKIKIVGLGKPHVALVGCIHGDEFIGRNVIEALDNFIPEKGTLSLVIAHPAALRAGKRFIEQDLNRSFPGKPNGKLEERLAHLLFKIQKTADFVIDIHGTDSDINNVAVVASLSEGTKELLKLSSAMKVILMTKKVGGNKGLISFAKRGISLEYGPNKAGLDYGHALAEIKRMLISLMSADKKPALYREKFLYKVHEPYFIPESFLPSSGLHEFELVKIGDTLGYLNGFVVRASEEFYPLFLGKGRYEKTLCLMASRESVEL